MRIADQQEPRRRGACRACCICAPASPRCPPPRVRRGVQRHLCAGRGRAVLPHGVDGVPIHRRQASRRRAARQPFPTSSRRQACARRGRSRAAGPVPEVLFDPCLGAGLSTRCSGVNTGGVHLLANLHGVASIDEDRRGLSASTTAAPQEPVKPVRQASRSEEGGTYSLWYSSVRGTTKPSSPRRVSSARSAATRPAPWRGSAVSSKDWN